MAEEDLLQTTEAVNQSANQFKTQGEFEKVRALGAMWKLPKTQVEAFLSGSRLLLVDADITEKQFTDPVEKMMEEMLILSQNNLSERICDYLLEKCREDAYAKQILYQHKSVQKCMDYVLAKAYEMAKQQFGDENMRSQEKCLAVEGAIVFDWVDAYYALDDEKEERKRKEKWIQDLTKERKTSEEAKTEATEGNSLLGQMSIFDLLDVKEGEAV